MKRTVNILFLFFSVFCFFLFFVEEVDIIFLVSGLEIQRSCREERSHTHRDLGLAWSTLVCTGGDREGLM